MALRALWDVTQQFQNKNGSNLTSGKIYIYYQGRTALATTYHDEDGTVVNSNPVLLDNNGRATAFADPIYSYTIVVCDYYGKELFSQDITLHDAISSAEDVVVLGTDGTVLVDRTELDNGVQYDLSVNTDIIATKQSVDDVKDDLDDLSDVVDNHTNKIGQLEDDVDDIEQALTNKKDKQTAKSFDGAATKTVSNISQNANGEITVEYEDIDLPPEVPNVEITSEDSSIQVTESTDAQTNTKTFDLSVNVDDPLEYGQFRATNVSTRATLNKIKGNLNLNNNAIALKKGNSYHFTLRGTYVPGTASNTYTNLTYIEYSAFQSINVNVDNTITDSQSFEISYDVYNLNSDLNYIVSFAASTSGTVSELWVEVHNLNGVSINGSGGGTYTAGDAIDITSNEVSVKYGKGLTVNASNELEIKAGTGLSFDEDTLEIEIDSEVSDVVETVEKLKEDLDSQLAVTYDIANITGTSDFSTYLTNGATMICQAFAVAINHAIRVDGEEDPTLLGIYFKNSSYTTKFILGLYVYDFEQGYTDYVGDTGPVSIQSQGLNQYPLKNKNPNIDELSSSKIYYACIYLPSTRNSGFDLASCPGYDTTINATPRFTIGVENIIYNGNEIDLSDPTAQLGYHDGNYNYYIGPWSDGYNERPTIPRFFMQIRNGTEPVTPIVAPFTDIGEYTLQKSNTVSSIFGNTVSVNSTTYGIMFQTITPAANVNITEWTVYDGNATDVRQWCGNSYSSDFATQLTSNSSGTLTELGEVSTGIYGHKFTLNTPLALTAGTTYRICAGIPISDSDTVVQYATPTNTKTMHLFSSGYNVSQWVAYSRVDNVQGTFLKLKDDNNNEWVI